MAIPRKQYLANALTQSKPWEALGMSRATWYRKGKPKSIPWRWKKRRLAIVVTPVVTTRGYRFFVVLSHVGRIPASEAPRRRGFNSPPTPLSWGQTCPQQSFETGLPAFDVDKSEEAL